MPTVISRGYRLTRDQVYSYVNSIGFITYDDCLNLAVNLYGMDEGTFKVLLGWDRNENYEYNTNTYDGYMCTCAAVNRVAGYGYNTPQSLCDDLRGLGPIAIYNVPRLQGLADQVHANETTQQLNLKCTFLALANPDQRVYGFAGGYTPDPSLVIYTTVDLGDNTVYATYDPRGERSYPYDVNGGVLGGGYDVYTDNGAPTLLSEFRAKIFHALACPTGYWSGMGVENYGYWNGSLFYFDCVNLIKAILSGWYDNRTVGYFEPLDSRFIDPQYGEYNEGLLIHHCANVSGDFTELNLTSVLFWDDHTSAPPQESGHIGCFVGEYTRDGKTYNTIECTSGSLGNGVVSSYVDSNGLRKPNKESAFGDIRWDLHGLLTPWLTYDCGNIDPGGSITPVNPYPGGGVVPPGTQRPPIRGLGRKIPLWMMLRDRNAQLRK